MSSSGAGFASIASAGIAFPEVTSSDIYIAAILGDDAAVWRYLTLDARNATAKRAHVCGTH